MKTRANAQRRVSNAVNALGEIFDVAHETKREAEKAKKKFRSAVKKFEKAIDDLFMPIEENEN